MYQIIKLMPENEWNIGGKQLDQEHSISTEEVLGKMVDLLMKKDNANSKRSKENERRPRWLSSQSPRKKKKSVFPCLQGSTAEQEQRPTEFKRRQPVLEHFAVDNIDLTHYRPLKCIREDALLDACYLAYYNHQPIVFNPDIVYAYLVKGIALHINKYPEEFRNLYVNHYGQKTLVYRNDSFVRGNKDNDWSLMFQNFADQLNDNTKENSLVQNDLKFTTSTKITEAHRNILAMESMKSYFEYLFMCGCGTACVILEGTAEDWKLLKEKINSQLVEINDNGGKTAQGNNISLKWWSPLVEILLDNFLATYQFQEKGEELSEELKLWWGAIFKYDAGAASMGRPEYITGWVNTFFPYLTEDEPNPWVLHWTPIAEDKQRMYSTFKSVLAPRPKRPNNFGWSFPSDHPDEIKIAPKSYRSYVASVPFKWEYWGEKFDMKALVGYSILARVEVAGGVYPKGTLKLFPSWVIYYDDNEFQPEDLKTDS